MKLFVRNAAKLRDRREEYVYRAVDPQWVDVRSGAILRDAFVLRPSENELSVYSSDVCSPRDVLQRIIDHLIERQQTKTGRDLEKFLEWVERKGGTVERRVELGWRVVRLPLFSFTDRGFEAGPTEPDGHIEIRGYVRSLSDLLILCRKWLRSCR